MYRKVGIEKNIVDVENNEYAIMFLFVEGKGLFYSHWTRCDGEPGCVTGWILLPADRQGGLYNLLPNVFEPSGGEVSGE